MRRCSSCRGVLLAVACLGGALLPALATADDRFPPNSPSGDASLPGVESASPIFANEQWTVWQSQRRYDMRSRALRILSQFYRQKVGDKEKVFVKKFQASYHRRVATVLDDGTVLFEYSSYLDWVYPERPARSEQIEIDGARSHVVAGWPDGLLLQRSEYGARLPVYFVPIGDGELKYDDKISITGDAGLLVNSLSRFVRSGGRLGYGRFLFDFESKERRPLSDEEAARVTALDASHAVVLQKDGHYLVSLAGDERRLVDTLNGPRLGSGKVFHLRDGVGYFFAQEGRKTAERDARKITLKSLDLRDADATPKSLLAIKTPNTRVGLFHLDERQVWSPTAKGLLVWDGEEFQTVAWESE